MSRLATPLTRRRRTVLTVLIVLCALGLLGVLTVGVMNGIVVGSTEDSILSLEEAATLTDIDYILVLGAGVKADGTPTDMLHDRVETGCALVAAGADGQLLMSGDNQRPEYDEVSAMVGLACDKFSVDAARIETDRLGLSTYESVDRAAALYGAERIIIVTQRYHLYRALYIAERMGIEAYGVSADVRSYWGQTMRDVREILARCKDLLLVQFE